MPIGNAPWGRQTRLQPALGVPGIRLPKGPESGSPVPRARRPTVPRVRLRGFTFVELMVVIAIIVILISMAIPIYNNTIRRANESVLKSNLVTLRSVIDSYTGDKLKAPAQLQDLVSAGYLREIPYDPITRSNTTWRIIMEESSQSVSQSDPGIFDVKSGSDKISSEGTPYADW